MAAARVKALVEETRPCMCPQREKQYGRYVIIENLRLRGPKF